MVAPGRGRPTLRVGPVEAGWSGPPGLERSKPEVPASPNPNRMETSDAETPEIPPRHLGAVIPPICRCHRRGPCELCRCLCVTKTNAACAVRYGAGGGLADALDRPSRRSPPRVKEPPQRPISTLAITDSPGLHQKRSPHPLSEAQKGGHSGLNENSSPNPGAKS